MIQGLFRYSQARQIFKTEIKHFKEFLNHAMNPVTIY